MTNYTSFPAVNCTKENFIKNTDLDYEKAYDQHDKEKDGNYYKEFDYWEGYSIVCPSHEDHIHLKGSEQSTYA